MKTNKILKIGLPVLGLIAIAAVTFILNDYLAGFLACSGVSLAFAAPVGTPVQETLTVQAVEEANPNVLDEDVIRKIVKIRPSATPLDTILRSLSGKGKTSSLKVSYFSSGVKEINTTVKTALVATSGSAANKIHQIALTDESFADQDDLLMFKDVNGKDGQMLVCHVIERGATPGTYNVMMLNGIGDSERDTPAIPEGTEVIRLSTAKNEKDARSADYAIVPENDFNYCQIIMSTLSQGLYEKMHAKKVDFELADLKDSAIYDFRRKCEGALLWGVRAKMYRPSDGRSYYHMDGIARKISKRNLNINMTSSKAYTAVVDITKHVFCGNNGSDKRIAFAGDDVLEWLDKKLAEESYRKIEAKSTEVVAGIEFNKISTNFGTLLVRPHGDFAKLGMGNKMLVFDPEYIELRNFRPMGIREIDNTKNGTELSNSFVIEETFTNIVTNEPVHSMITFAE